MSNLGASFCGSGSKILVTGGNGFIGSHVVDYLCSLGMSVTILDRFGKPHRPDVNFVLGDIRDRTLVFDLAKQHVGIINLAAILGTSETIDHPLGTVDSNILGALHIFDSAKEFGARVVHITVGNHWMNNPYAITKSAAEKFALWYNQKFDTKITVVRGLNAYGERQKPSPVRKIMPNFVLPAIRGEEILIYGNGEQRMDMIYVRDLAKILVDALLLKHNSWHRIIEAGTGIAPTVNEICTAVLELSESSSKIRHIPMRQGEPEKSVVCGDPKTLLPLGFTPDQFVSLQDGIRKTITYYREYGNSY